MKRLSSYRAIRHVALRRVDYYTLPGVQVHLLHGPRCPRAEADRLCTCQDPLTYEVRA